MRFTIGRKIWVGFGVLIVSIILTFIFIYHSASQALSTFKESDKISARITNVNSPSQYAVVELKMAVVESKTLITKWALIQSREDDQDKVKLTNLINEAIPLIKDTIVTLSKSWNTEEDTIINTVFNEVNELLWLHEQIRTAINSFESYEDPTTILIYRPMVLPEGEVDVLTTKILSQLDDLIVRLDKNTRNALLEETETRIQTSSSFEFLNHLLIWLLIAMPIYGIFVALFTTRSIVRPVTFLKAIIQNLGKGIFPKNSIKPSNDEIGEMTIAVNQLVDGMHRTTDFANEVGKSNFNYPYQPLSNEDILGHALLKMRDELAVNERILEKKVEERTAEVVRQKEQLEDQKQKIELLYKDVTDSIRYAKRLQESILPSLGLIKKLLPESFVLYRPKDIVSGDFYWFEKSQNRVLFAAVDCTGHGVPGAFMSLVGSNGLNSAVNEHGLFKPSDILNDLHRLAYNSLNQEKQENQVRDGMDVALCSYHPDTMILEYAGAYNPLYLVRNKEIIQTKADKFPIGGDDVNRQFTNHSIQLQSGDSYYIFSDGFADQFGGEKGKKFMYSRFRELLVQIQDSSMKEQHEILNDTLNNWKENYEQIDDILVIGVRV